MSHGDDVTSGRHGILNDKQVDVGADHQRHSDRNRATPQQEKRQHSALGDKGSSGAESSGKQSDSFLPPILKYKSDTHQSRGAGHERKSGSSRSRSRGKSRLSGSGSGERNSRSVHFPELGEGETRSGSSRNRTRGQGQRSRSRLGEGVLGETGEETPDSEQDLSDYDSDDERETDAGRSDMNDKNQNVIRFVYSEAVRQALKNTYELVHPLLTIPASTLPEDQPKINFEIIRLPEIYADVNNVLTYASEHAHRRGSRDKDTISGTDSHTSVSTRRSLKQDSRDRVGKNKLGDIGKRQSGKSIASDNSRSDKSVGKSKKKNGQTTKTVHFPALQDNACVSSGSKIHA